MVNLWPKIKKRAMKQKNIETNLTKVYNSYPQAFDLKNVKKLVRYYWKTFDGIEFPMTEESHEKATSEESITRARRKVIELHGVKSEESKQRELEYHDYYANKGLCLESS